MPPRAPRSDRRTDALSKDRIVATAVEILDADGEDALTFRTLTARLSTGAGAVYHHVAGKDELLSAATAHLVDEAMAVVQDSGDARETVRAVALGVYDVIDAHPWVGTQLAREPWQTAMLPVLERFGTALHALGLSRRAQFDGASALLNVVLGLAGQHAAAARLLPHGTDRVAFLAAMADRWSELDRTRYPFLHRLADELPGHDDRDQFLAGIDLILAGVTAAGRTGK